MNDQAVLWTDRCRNIGWRYYLVFIIPSFVWVIVIQFTFPDTKGMPLEEVATLFGVSIAGIELRSQPLTGIGH